METNRIFIKLVFLTLAVVAVLYGCSRESVTQPLTVMGCFDTGKSLPIYRICFYEDRHFEQFRTTASNSEVLFNRGTWEHGDRIDEGLQRMYVWLHNYSQVDGILSEKDVYVERSFSGSIRFYIYEGQQPEVEMYYFRTLENYIKMKQ